MDNIEFNWKGPSRCNTESLRSLIKEHCIEKRLKAGEIYLSPGDPIYNVAYVASGVTSHYMFGENGREKVMYRLGPGWFFSEGIFYADAYPTEMATRYAIAETETVLYLMNRENFTFLLSNLEFVQALLCSTVEKCTLLRHEIESVTFDTTAERLKQLLISCADTEILIDGIWCPVIVSWTHHDIAAIIGITRVSVSRLITDLKNEGFLRMVNGRMQINEKYII